MTASLETRGGTIDLERRNRIAVVTLNRPGRKNTFDETMFRALETVTGTLRKDPPRAVVITGAGEGSFCAGFDVNPENPMVAGILEAFDRADPQPARSLIRRIRRAVDGFVSLPVPLIAAVNGPAYGGGLELAVRCDLRVMEPAADLCFSEVRLGLMPDWGGGPVLTRLVGAAVASDLILTARTVGSGEALRLGLVNRISSPGRSLPEALDLAEQIARNGPRAVRRALAVIRRSRDLSIPEALELEAETAAELIAPGECLHGVTAFMEKKTPDFPD